MAHDNVLDTDLHFIIDPTTKLITSASGQKKKLAQLDHNSEVLSFELPRTVENHDMELCTEVLIHYTNTDLITKEENKGIYEVKDLKAAEGDDDTLVFTWHIEESVTLYGGSLVFSIEFLCTLEGKVDYRWSTFDFSDISVEKRTNNSGAITKKYPDIIVNHESRITALEKGGTGGTGDTEDAGGTDEPVKHELLLPAPEKFGFSRISANSHNFSEMAYGNGRFVCVGVDNSENVVIITADFVNYKRVVLPERWERIKFVNGYFFLIGQLEDTGRTKTSNFIKRSDDCETWTDIALPDTTYWSDIEYGGGYYVAISGRVGNSNISIYSTDLDTWHQSPLPASAQWQALRWGNGWFVAVTFSGDYLAVFTPSRLEWVNSGALTGGYFFNIYFHKDRFYLPISGGFGESTNQIIVGNPLEFEKKTLPVSGQWQAMAFGAGYGVVFAHSLDAFTKIKSACYTADDGETWKEIEMPLATSRVSAAYGKGSFACLGGGFEFCHLADNY